MHEEFSSAHKSHYEEDFGVCLEHVVEADEEGVGALLEDLFFCQS